jgi:hypothetical protein
MKCCDFSPLAATRLAWERVVTNTAAYFGHERDENVFFLPRLFCNFISFEYVCDSKIIF